MASPLIVAGGVWFIAGEPRVSEALSAYVYIRLISAPFALVNYAVLGYVLGRGEGGIGLVLQLILNLSNIALSILLGLWLGWGLEGVAWGTVGGEALAMVIGLVFVIRRFRRMPAMRQGAVTDLPALKAMLAINRDIMIRSFVLLGAFALLAREGAQLGTLTLAANAVLMNFLLLNQLSARRAGHGSRTDRRACGRGTLRAGLRPRGPAYPPSGASIFGRSPRHSVSCPSRSADCHRHLRRRRCGKRHCVNLPLGRAHRPAGRACLPDGRRPSSAPPGRGDMRNMMLVSFTLYLVAAVQRSRGTLAIMGCGRRCTSSLLARGLSLLAILPLRGAAPFLESFRPDQSSRLSAHIGQGGCPRQIGQPDRPS